MQATRVENAFVVSGGPQLVGAEWCLTLDIDPEHPFQSYKRLPDVIECGGKTYGKTGFNSDTNVAHYSTRALIARTAEPGMTGTVGVGVTGRLAITWRDAKGNRC